MAYKDNTRQNWHLPDGARIAVTVNMALEAFRLKSQLTLEARAGRKDHFSLSYGAYGARAGIWRLLDFLDEMQIKGSMSTNGRAAELYPEAVKAVAKAGHEIVGHGWENDVLTPDDNVEAELDEIRRVTRAIEDAAGTRPRGWTSPGSAGSANTLSLLAQEGYVWNGDVADDDLPYSRQTANGTMMMMPRVNMPMNDLIMWSRGATSPEVIWDNFKDTFDQLYREGMRGEPKWLEFVLHAQMAGRPTLIPVMRRCLNYALEHEGVWIPRKGDLALWAAGLERVDLTGRIGAASAA